MTLLSRRKALALCCVTALGVGAFSVSLIAFDRADTAIVMAPPEALAAAARGEILIVDIRRPDEWDRTGIAEYAVGIDMRDEDFISKLTAARVSNTQPIAVICARGVRSARMTRRLEEAGIRPLIDIPEGMLGSPAGPGWIARALPVVQVN
ncbi:MAG: rhodanese-like domain-containing protein [Pseudomonadota bacterium]